MHKVHNLDRDHEGYEDGEGYPCVQESVGEEPEGPRSLGGEHIGVAAGSLFRGEGRAGVDIGAFRAGETRAVGRGVEALGFGEHARFRRCLGSCG